MLYYLTPYTETAGSYINMMGQWQKFNGVTKPLGESKPAWKVLRVLGNALNIDGFEYNSIDDVRNEMAPLAAENIDLYIKTPVMEDKVVIEKPDISKLVRFGISGAYSSDSIVRRSSALQNTKIAKLPTLSISQKLADKIGAKDGNNLELTQDAHSATYQVTVSNDLPDTVVLLASNGCTTEFGGRFDNIEIKVG